MNIHKYDHTKGSKAFSYFSVVAKNYLILHNNNNYKKLKTHDELSVLDSAKNKKIHNNVDMKHLTEEVIDYFESNLPTMFKKQRDIKIAYSIIELMKRIDDIENFNKKSLYILIREMADVDTTHITKVMNVFRTHYKKILNEFDKYGMVNLGKIDKFI